MTAAPALVIFDVDGTLVDSQAHILASMTAAFEAAGRPAPARDAVLGVVGLSLPVAIARLAPDLPDREVDLWVDRYKAAFADLRSAAGSAAASPLYPGARSALDRLHRVDTVLLGVATGKSRRGLDHVLAVHDLAGYFVTTQVADDHPSKPDPSMIHAALAATGVDPARAVIVGDTSYDIEMGRAAGIGTIGVAWGYHGTDRLAAAGADSIVDGFEAVMSAVLRRMEAA